MALIFGKKKKKIEKRALQSVMSPSAPFGFVEAFKSLRTNIKFISKSNGSKVFILTSALPEESKSNTCINLATTMAEDGRKVLVLDCDLRKPSISHYLKIGRSQKGVTDVLLGDASLESSIVRFSDLKIHVLCAGTVPPNPAELLAGDGFKKLMERLRQEYDYIFIDTPPVSVVTDATIVGHLADGAIMVVRSKYATVDVINLAKKRLTDVGIKIFGVIITRFDIKKTAKNSAYSYQYQYNYYKEK